MIDRRHAIKGLATGFAGLALLLALGPLDAEAAPRHRHRRRVRRRVRRRIRRRVVVRPWRGVTRWVVPAAVAVGWELQHGDTVVVVQEITTVEVEGEVTEAIVTEDGQTIYIVREDDETNSKPQQGSMLPDSDTTSPYTESEEEVGR